MYFAVMIKDDEGMSFRLYETLDEAHEAANKAAGMAVGEVTVFDYDAESKTYLEFYSI